MARAVKHITIASSAASERQSLLDIITLLCCSRACCEHMFARSEDEVLCFDTASAQHRKSHLRRHNTEPNIDRRECKCMCVFPSGMLGLLLRRFLVAPFHASRLVLGRFYCRTGSSLQRGLVEIQFTITTVTTGADTPTPA